MKNEIGLRVFKGLGIILCGALQTLNSLKIK